MTNLEWYLVFDKAKSPKENCIGKQCLCAYPRHNTTLCHCVTKATVPLETFQGKKICCFRRFYSSLENLKIIL